MVIIYKLILPMNIYYVCGVKGIVFVSFCVVTIKHMRQMRYNPR
jgi:hypothetical protein